MNLEPLKLRDGRSISFERAGVVVFGVVNATPDSFSDGGRYDRPDAAIAHGLALAQAGATVLDIGGESTRPGSDPVSADEQKRRVLPVIDALVSRGLIVSIDTTSAEVARAALDLGAHIVNDISAFRFDPAMLPLLAERGVPAIAMHTLGAPKTMQVTPLYDDVVAEVRDHLAERVELAVAAGVVRSQLIIDPGIGFGKTLEHNLSLLKHTAVFVALGQPVLVGTSRKRFLGAITGREVADRVVATAASSAIAVALGAHLVRVHDVAEVIDAIRVGGAIRDAR
jgi:dihydropteroate synthase